jgi:hypothetical protein
VEDETVRFARERGNPCRHVVVIESHGADQQVESATLRPHLDATVDDVDEEEALVLALEELLTAAPERTKLSSRTARITRSRVSARGLPWPLRTRETEAMETPARLATS